MKSIFCYTLPLVLAISSLVAGPKPEPKKLGSSEIADPKTSVEQQTEISRRAYDSLSVNDASALQARDPTFHGITK